MGIFSSIKKAIFGDKKKDDAAATPRGGTGIPSSTGASTVAPVTTVDVEAELERKAAGQNLNWRTSIVDLMKLLGIDSSYENRKELAQELGRTDYSGTAEDNIWLHKATMRELAKNGGKVPADMLD